MIKYSIGSLERLINKEDKTILEWILTIAIMTIGIIWLVTLLIPILIFIVIISLPVGLTEWLKSKNKQDTEVLQLESGVKE